MRYPTWTPELRIPILMGGFVEKRGETCFKIYTQYIPKALPVDKSSYQVLRMYTIILWSLCFSKIGKIITGAHFVICWLNFGSSAVQ